VIGKGIGIAATLRRIKERSAIGVVSGLHQEGAMQHELRPSWTFQERSKKEAEANSRIARVW